jgi:hypothetical protein
VAMYLVQMLLPLASNEGKRLPRKLYADVQKDLTERFHGLTAYSRAPAEGLWKPRVGTKRDDIVVYEVMTESIDEQWWTIYRKRLELMFQQESVVIRAQKMRVL